MTAGCYFHYTLQRGTQPTSSAFRRLLVNGNVSTLLTLYWQAPDEGISRVALQARAYGRVVDHPAGRIGRTQMIQARVGTHVIDAGLVVVTVRGHDTFGATARRTTVVARQARAHCLVMHSTTLRVGTTRGGHAGVTLHQVHLQVHVAR